jgi:hypothetical protein
MAQLSDADMCLPNEIGIWRYMDVARFLTLIDESKLYFARLHELGDPWEGSWSKADSDELLSGSDPESRRRAVHEFNRLALISCWHENQQESVAMWKLYVSGREGVALKTTVGRLRRVLTVNSVTWRRPTITRIRYGDITASEACDFGGILHAESPLFRKNVGYEHEREVRAVIYDPHDCALVALQTANEAADRPSHHSEVGRGEAVPVDLSILIERIVVSPDFPKWAVASLQKIVEALDLHVQVESSSLLNQPPAELLGKS